MAQDVLEMKGEEKTGTRCVIWTLRLFARSCSDLGQVRSHQEDENQDLAAASGGSILLLLFCGSIFACARSENVDVTLRYCM